MQHVWGHIIFGSRREKTSGLRTKKGLDKPAHLRSLNNIIICLLEGNMAKLAASEISIF